MLPAEQDGAAAVARREEGRRRELLALALGKRVVDREAEQRGERLHGLHLSRT